MTNIKHRFLFIVPFLGLFLGALTLDVSAQDAKVLGFRAATKFAANGSVNVKSSTPVIRRIKFKSTIATVRISNVRIDFRNGTSKRIRFDKLIGAGMESDPIEIDAGERRIKRISFTSVAISFKGRNALVFVYGED
jgi:hypothetical protein